MKTPAIKWTHTCFCALVALTLAAALPVKSFAQDAQKGGAKQLELSNMTVGKTIQTAVDLAAAEVGDQIVMSCPKCKSATVTTVTMAGKGAFEKKTTTSQHLCPGCATALESVGHGKAKTDKIVHKCAKCGSEDAFCCVVKKGASPTKGM